VHLVPPSRSASSLDDSQDSETVPQGRAHNVPGEASS
jgi:hypothetical protein